jgi:uncharacterized repeat protein (TIGR03803 family)
MQGKRLPIGLRVGLAIFTVALFVTSTWADIHDTVLHNFNNNGTDGASPQAGLIVDGAGNLYGTTNNGGTYNYGTVFELTPAAGGSYTEKVLHNFTNGADGGNPQSGLILDGAGNLYGTTYVGGNYGYGTAFELTPAGNGTWNEKVLYSFGSGNTAYPTSGLIFDGAGNLYGTTLQGGPAQGGSVFELSPAGGGNWTERDLHDFGSLSSGLYPYGGVVFDGAGNLYGTTSTGGTSSGGTVFELAAGSWTMRVLHNFSGGADGEAPYAGLVLAAGNLYGTTSGGGSSGGTVFEFTPAGGGGWTYQVVHNFGTGNDGSTPYAGLIADTAGNLYGTTLGGGTYGGGSVFRFNAHGGVVLHSFGLPEGYGPVASLIFDTAGNLYGTAQFGGTYGYGTVFQVIPPTALQFVTATPCRLVDTRPEHGGSGPIQGGTFQNFPIPQEGGCNIPTTAAAYSLNVSVVPSGPLGYLTIWPTGENRPVVATLNSLDGRIKADAAIVPAGTSGAVSVYVTNTTNVILDINGYFAPVSGSTLAFYPLPPCRVADTRHSTYPPGLGPPYLTGHQERNFPILNATSCNIPANAAAYSLNFSVVPHGGLGYLTVWPTGQSQPLVSTLNDLPGTIIANAAIVPAGAGGDVSVYPSSDTDLVIDINGYFAPTGPNGLSLYAATPCRVIDTRLLGPPFSGTLSPPVDVVDSACGLLATAQAYVFNATVVPAGGLGYLTLWPDGANQPLVSTLNALDGSITNNMAIVPSTNGKVDAYAAGLTQLILDISSYFAP